MESIENGATIRIGLWNIDCRLREDPLYCGIPEYSLKINKKTEIIIGCGDPVTSAEEIAKIMIKKGIRNYVLYNGERIDWNTKKWESCEEMSIKEKNDFKKTLEKKLNETN